MHRTYSSTLHIALLLASISCLSDASTVVEVSDVAQVWAGHPVGFGLLSTKNGQYVAYYDGDRRMTVAYRDLPEGHWRYHVLPESIGWDSHNGVTMALDASGHLHVSGNMHVHPLVYFRTAIAGHIESLKRIPAMTGQEEDRVTYPRFIEAPDDALVFTYRDGSSGSGNQIYNLYDVATRQWHRLLDRPLTDGQGEMNAYPVGPLVGPDGHYHMCWVWRDTPDCATNHNLCYARSKDLVHWETAAGEPHTLPITLATADVVDPVPAGGGIINGNTRVGFDSRNRPVIAYHKYDETGKTQLYNARFEGESWVIYQTSNWNYRWEFSGGGSISFEIGVSPVKYEPGVGLTQAFRNEHEGSGIWTLDEDRLQIIEIQKAVNPWPSEIRALRSTFPGMTVRWASDSGSAPEGARYVLRWETLGPNRDRAREKPWPEASALQVVCLTN